MVQTFFVEKSDVLDLPITSAYKKTLSIGPQKYIKKVAVKGAKIAK